MKITHKDLRNGIVSVSVDNMQDLWYLSHIIMQGDRVKGKTTRKVEINEKDKVKKTYVLTIQVEKVDYQESVLRINGVITEGPDDLDMGSYQSISLEIRDRCDIIKEKWSTVDLKRLEDASKEGTDTLILSLDRDTACFALLKKKGYQVLSTLRGEVQKKGYETEAKDFFGQVHKQLEEYYNRYKPTSIVVASPSFWKENFGKNLKEELKSKVIYANSSSGDESGIKEVMKQEAVSKALKSDSLTKQIQFVEELLKEIKTTGKAAYGWEETKKAIEAGAVEVLLVTDRFLKDAREKGIFEEVDKLMGMVEQTQGSIYIIDEANQAGSTLEGFGGVGGLLRYKLQ